MAKEISVASLRKRLEERRRRCLGMVKALDHLGIRLEKLPGDVMREFAERDADCAVCLLKLAQLPGKRKVVHEVKKIETAEQRLDELEIMIFAHVGPGTSKTLRAAHEVAMSIIDDDDLYEG